MNKNNQEILTEVRNLRNVLSLTVDLSACKDPKENEEISEAIKRIEEEFNERTQLSQYEYNIFTNKTQRYRSGRLVTKNISEYVSHAVYQHSEIDEFISAYARMERMMRTSTVSYMLLFNMTLVALCDNPEGIPNKGSVELELLRSDSIPISYQSDGKKMNDQIPFNCILEMRKIPKRVMNKVFITYYNEKIKVRIEHVLVGNNNFLTMPVRPTAEKVNLLIDLLIDNCKGLPNDLDIVVPRVTKAISGYFQKPVAQTPDGINRFLEKYHSKYRFDGTAGSDVAMEHRFLLVKEESGS